MTEIFEKNLKAMEKWYPPFVELVRSRTEEMAEEKINIQEETSWDGEQIYRIEMGGRRLYLNGKRNVKETVSHWQERLGEIHKYAPFLLVGMGSGIYLKKLCETADESVTIMVYEPSAEIFLYTLNHVDLSGCMEKRLIAFIVDGVNGEEMSPVLRKLVTDETIEYFKEEIHPNYQELFPEQVLGALRRADRVTEDVFIDVRTGIKFADVMVRNQIQNMRYVLDGYNVVGLAKALDTSPPAVLVSAGPSLNKNIGELKEAKGKAFILAVDTALKPLLKEGVVPDAFVTIDAKKPLVVVDAEAVKDIPVIASSTANCELLGGQRNKKIFYFDGHMLSYQAYACVGKRLREAHSGGSVACSAFSVLYKMGFTTIILVGQDLAYTGKKSHADGTFQEVMPEENTEGMLLVKGNYEEKVPTRADFKKYIDWFSDYIPGAKKERELRVINATEGGAWLEGTELMTLHDALRETCGRTVDFAAAIRGMEPDFTEQDKETIGKYLKGVSKEFLEIKKEAGKLKSAYKKVDKLSRSGKMDKGSYLKHLKRIKKLNNSCESKRTAYQLINASMPLAEYIVKSESLAEMDSIEEQAKAVAKQGMKYAGFIQECAEILRGYMEESFADVRGFREE